MSHVAQSTIAQAIYANPQDCNFVRVVTELEVILSRLRNTSLRTRWDYEDIVVFDIGNTRIVLGWSEDRTHGAPACLLVSVGPVPAFPEASDDAAHELLCSRLIERIQTRYLPDVVLWRQLPLAIEPELVDALIDAMPPITDMIRPAEPPDTWPDHGEVTALPAALSPFAAANDAPNLPHPSTAELARLRAALYPEETAQGAMAAESAQMRLAAQAMNATLIVVWMPLGVAAMTYTLLKGEKIGFSARMMAITGTLIGVTQSPFAQQVAAMAGV